MSNDDSELKKLMWKKLGNHMTDSGEYTVEDVDKVFQEIVETIRKDFPMKDWEIRGWLDKDNIMEYIMSGQAKEIAEWFLKVFGAR